MNRCACCDYTTRLAFVRCPSCGAVPLRLCAHCAQPMRGYATVGPQYLCHPDDGIDCYKMVTVYRHPTPCAACTTEAVAA